MRDWSAFHLQYFATATGKNYICRREASVSRHSCEPNWGRPRKPLNTIVCCDVRRDFRVSLTYDFSAIPVCWVLFFSSGWQLIIAYFGLFFSSYFGGKLVGYMAGGGTWAFIFAKMR